PSGDKLTIRSVGVEKFSTVRIFNTTGQLTHNIPDFKREVTLNAKEILAPGVYIIKATNDKKVITRKVVIR
ncbi:MAG TPA: T9SS type A sorting domain-containing protein, partial [Ohtaekwangia sp.]